MNPDIFMSGIKKRGQKGKRGKGEKGKGGKGRRSELGMQG
jgi:hypothetical protein